MEFEHFRRTVPALKTTLALPLLAALLAGGCAQRDRLTFPVAPTGPGPQVTIEVPTADTVVAPGPALLVSGHATGANPLDTVYFDVVGGVSSFSPYIADPGQDTVSFQLPITTQGLSGDTMFVQVRAVDVLGLRGSSVQRRVVVQ